MTDPDQARMDAAAERLMQNPEVRQAMAADDVLEAMARGICQERCAFMGEPACWQLDADDGGPYPFPAEGCGDVNCVDMARAAIRALPAGWVVAKVPEEVKNLFGSERAQGHAEGWNTALGAVQASAVAVE